MATDKRRITITVDTPTADLLTWLAEATELTESGVINRLLGSHVEELWELRTWLEQVRRDSKEWALGTNLLTSYGPDDLLKGIKRIDPNYETMGERFERGLRAEASERSGAAVAQP
ncbi:hypothetical protein KTE23_02595 [Burkholderia multivorans]|uniref:hypothetical protein n=1 Tax=Burkholderia multivorans TaxID=87883 RepID=UPI0012DD2B62|nr:hypothetical protein [Burkholderia multivorans]MBU9415469.1 hypothetical protein [Burkholderia multivorans]QGR88206.1 hypothetical protein FOC34_23860 [Burkholderia multivorans]